MAVDLTTSVLVVDDYGTMIRIIRKLLEQIGFRGVDFAMGGADALSQLGSRGYGLVISDWNMEQ
jgi:two-component system, chemotaxis family, chemotaxis protein CheY